MLKAMPEPLSDAGIRDRREVLRQQREFLLRSRNHPAETAPCK